MDMDNEVLRAIRERRSIRKYRPEQIKDEELQAVLEAGTWAPSGMGYQNSYICAVQDKETCDKIRRLNGEVLGNPEADPYYGAPTIILVFSKSDWHNTVKDGSLVLGTMLLAASTIGLGGCWINRCEEVFASEGGKALLGKLKVPEGYEAVGSMSLGYPAAPARAPRPRKEDYFRVIK